MIFSYSFNCWPMYCFWFEGDIRPAFSYIELIFTILILRSEHLVSFLSRNEPSFLLFFFFFSSPLPWCWVSIFSPDSWLSVLSERKRWLWQYNAEPWPKKASEKHLDPPSQDGSAIFQCWVSYVSALKSLVGGRDIFKEVLKIICKGPRYTW